MYNLNCILFKTAEVFFYMSAGLALEKNNIYKCIILWGVGVIFSIIYFSHIIKLRPSK